MRAESHTLDFEPVPAVPPHWAGHSSAAAARLISQRSSGVFFDLSQRPRLVRGRDVAVPRELRRAEARSARAAPGNTRGRMHRRLEPGDRGAARPAATEPGGASTSPGLVPSTCAASDQKDSTSLTARRSCTP